MDMELESKQHGWDVSTSPNIMNAHIETLILFGGNLPELVSLRADFWEAGLKLQASQWKPTWTQVKPTV